MLDRSRGCRYGEIKAGPMWGHVLPREVNKASTAILLGRITCKLSHPFPIQPKLPFPHVYLSCFPFHQSIFWCFSPFRVYAACHLFLFLVSSSLIIYNIRIKLMGVYVNWILFGHSKTK